MIGKTLAHYQVEKRLGSGGMGEVYVAHDAKLNRKVALKLLPPEMAADEERRSRFAREAQVVAALSHPNIVTVYAVEESDGVHFMTMELVKGNTLSELIPKNGFALDRFFETAIPLADAIAAAHEQGITHRDLKPGNIMVSDEGRVKVLDFGLAKMQGVLPGGTGSELPTAQATADGRILGTVAYMSPEQAEGKSVGHRSDIFSLGVVLYEMLTGERPFSGDSPATILSSILKDTPTSVTELNKGVPRELGKIVRRCLAKDPGRRFQSVIDVRNEIEELKEEVQSGEVLAGAVAVSPRPGRFGLGIVAGAVVVLAAFGAYLVLAPSRESGPPSVRSVTQLTFDPGQEAFPSLSPDGERIAFRSEREGGGLFVMGATGESVRRLTDFGYNPAWSSDGETIFFATHGVFDSPRVSSTSEIWAADVATGETTRIREADAVEPSASPHGERIAYWGITEGGQRDISTIRVDGSDLVSVTNDEAVDVSPVWSPDGRYLYFSSNRGGSLNLWRVRIDEASGEVLGAPEPLTTPSQSALHLSFGGDGQRGVYTDATTTSNVQKLAFDTEEQRVLGEPMSVTEGSMNTGRADPSPDGEWITFQVRGTHEDIFVARADGTDRRQLTDDVHNDRLPRWSPDGRRIAFYSDRSGSYQIWTVGPDGSDLRQLTDDPNLDHLTRGHPEKLGYPTWSPDGSRMAVSEFAGNAYLIDPDKPSSEQSLEALPPMSDPSKRFAALSWSPDGKLLAGGWLEEGLVQGTAVYSLDSKEYGTMMDGFRWPVWLKDNRRLIVGTPAGKLFLLDNETMAIREIFRPSLGRATVPSISADNRTLYFRLVVREADLWLVELN